MNARKWITVFAVPVLVLAPLLGRAAERGEEREGASERPAERGGERR